METTTKTVEERVVEAGGEAVRITNEIFIRKARPDPYRGDVTLFACDVTQFNGCCGIAIAHAFYTMDFDWVRNNATLVSDIILEAVRVGGWRVAMASDVVDSVMAEVLEASGWSVLYEFDNPNSGNRVKVFAQDSGFEGYPEDVEEEYEDDFDDWSDHTYDGDEEDEEE
jgi:hypothetical protein